MLLDVIESVLLSHVCFLLIFLRAIMSDEGEKTCPLCAEEMDLTDQQLKPCKCGYEVCFCFFVLVNFLLLRFLFYFMEL